MTRQRSRLNSSDDFNRRLFWSVPSCWFFAESSTLRSVRFSDGKGALLFLYHRNKQDFHSPDIRKDSTISCYEVLYAITSFVLQLFCNDKYYCPVKLFGCIRIFSNHARCSLNSIFGVLTCSAPQLLFDRLSAKMWMKTYHPCTLQFYRMPIIGLLSVLCTLFFSR